MAASIGAAGDLFRLVRKGIDVRAVQAHTRRPFRFLLCGDPLLVTAMRTLLLRGHTDGVVPLEAASTLETIDAGRTQLQTGDARCIIFLGSRGSDVHEANLGSLRSARLPIFAITVDPEAQASGPPSAPAPGTWAEYVVPEISRDALRGRFFPQLIDVCKSVEIAIGRNLPALRETVAAKLTRDAANSALKVALASALVDHVPVVGIVLGALASAGDTVAITGIQMMLLLHIEAAYGKDPDLQRLWQLLPVVGGGFGWRMLARELSGFIPVAGIAIKGAIAYAGTIVVGEGVTFYHEHGAHMSKGEASAMYERTKSDALAFARDLASRFTK
ncbi:MAG: hypothetical protein DLM50_00585 [Candidatus Meridianibacter frigidus]|nr:MAG: hypothetical protein DLM50_00585 [Candidatus Eremiobacteraeota bacterium]